MYVGPATYAEPATVETSAGADQFVRTDVTDALLCTYASDTDGGRLVKTSTLAQGTDALTADLNALEPAGADEGKICAKMAGPQWRIALGYAAGPPTVVDINANCGTASAGTQRRLLRSVKNLLDHWQR